MTGPNLFGVPAKARKAKAPKPSTGTAVTELIAAWAALFEARFGEKPLVTGKDAAALKRLVEHGCGDVGLVRRRLAAYLRLDDAFLAGQGYPLSLLLGQWNRLVALEAPEAGGRQVQDADATQRLLDRNLGRAR
jgi:hypothetical protein